MATAGRTINTSIYLKRSFRKWMGFVLLVLLILQGLAGCGWILKNTVK